MPSGSLRSAHVTDLEVVQHLLEDPILLGRPIALGLLPKQDQQIDRIGGLGQVDLALTREGIWRVAQRDHGRTRQHHEEPGQASFARGGIEGRRARRLRRRGGGIGGGLAGRFVVVDAPAPVCNLKDVFGLTLSHWGEPSTRENPCCIIG